MSNKKDDFFNLNSDSEAEEASSDLKSNKWDWDKPENYDLYFKNTKRSLEISEESSDVHSGKKTCKSDEELANENAPKTNFASNSNFKIKQMIGHTDCVNRIYWSKKNENVLLSSSMDGTIIIWDISKNEKNSVIRKFSSVHSKSIRNAIWSNYETEVASVSYDQSCVISSVETGEEMNKLKCEHIPTSITTNPTNDNIYLIGLKNQILAWDHRMPKICKRYESKMGQVQDLLFLSNTEFISSGDVVFRESAEYALMVWDYETNACVSNQIYHEKFISTCLKKHPYWNCFYAQTHGNYIAEFSSRRPYKMNKFKRYEGHETQSYNIGFDINLEGTMLVSGSIDGNAIIYNLATSKIIKKINVFRKQTVIQPCMDAKFHPNNKNKIGYSCYNGLICIYND